MTTAEWLAAQVTDLSAEEVTEPTFHAARRCLIDALGCAAAGHNEPAVRSALQWARQTYATGPSTVWFAEDSLTPVGAAFVNATAASILDLDDGHRAAAGHPGAAIIPAALAQGQAQGASLRDILLAIIVGYEAGVRCAVLRTQAAQATVATGRWSAVGVAATVAKLRGFDGERTRHALTIAEAHAPNLLAADHSGFQGGYIKEGIPWSVVAGFAAADLAGHGFKGYDASFSNPAMYRGRAPGDDPKRLLIETTYYKRYACCRWTHSAVDAAIELNAGRPPTARIDRIVIETFERAFSLPNHVQPADVISAQFSLPFVVAAGLVRGSHALMPMDAVMLSDPEIIGLAERIQITVDDELERMFPAKVPARVRIEWSDGSRELLVVSPLGDHDHPLSDRALMEKALHLANCNGVETLSTALLEEILAGESRAETVLQALRSEEKESA
ncbi:MmgE/PrpD family protein [Hydrogenophaga sp.]|jgi:2-methylcitrate dehydratase PrpD|uniref:MmgE/PrpD family protein n=1 Tax=Hydrogenophaga sp. TaxID=1904254 RepID=UPI003F705B48